MSVAYGTDSKTVQRVQDKFDNILTGGVFAFSFLMLFDALCTS